MNTKILILIFALILTGCHSQGGSDAAESTLTEPKPLKIDESTQQQIGIQVIAAQGSSASAPILATGQLQLNEDKTWKVGAVIEGRLVSVPVHLGDTVKAGQVVALMHSHDVHDSRANRRQAVAELERLKVLAEQARRVRDRTKRLLDLKAASQEQMEAAETQIRSAQLSVTNAEAEVQRTETHLREFLDVPVQEEEGSEAAEGHDNVPIKTPADGTVMERLANVGTVVSVATPVVTISDLSSLWFIAAVNEADLQQIRRGQAATISVRAYPDRKFAGTVFQLGERLDPQTRTLQVRLLVKNSGGLLKPDMFASVEFAPQDSRRVIQVPESAIQELNGKTIVFVRLADKSFSARPVVLGKRVGGQVEILSGLETDTPVVVNGALLLKGQLLKSDGN